MSERSLFDNVELDSVEPLPPPEQASGEPGEPFEYSGTALLVQHCAVHGRLETDVSWVRADSPGRYAQYDRAVTVRFRRPGQRRTRYIHVCGDNVRYATVEAAGKVLWDSRRVVPLDQARFNESRSRFPGASAAVRKDDARARHEEMVRQREQEREMWDATRSLVHDAFAPHGETLQHLLVAAREYFASQAEGKTFTRRPNLSLKLLATGEPAAHVVVRPLWRKPGGLDLSAIEVELVVHRLQGCPTVSLSLRVSDQCVDPLRWSLRRWHGDTARLAETVASFLANPGGTFARSSGHCCICHHALTDEVSRSRGIGPECHKGALWIIRRIEQLRSKQPAEVG